MGAEAGISSPGDFEEFPDKLEVFGFSFGWNVRQIFIRRCSGYYRGTHPPGLVQPLSKRTGFVGHRRSSKVRKCMHSRTMRYSCAFERLQRVALKGPHQAPLGVAIYT
jgi:hypothetical protein